MQDLQRRTVLFGAGVLVGMVGAPFVGAIPARAEPDPNDVPDLALLRRAFVLADEARRSGGAPYGALVAEADGKVIAEHRNTAWAEGGDPTCESDGVIGVIRTPSSWARSVHVD